MGASRHLRLRLGSCSSSSALDKKFSLKQSEPEVGRKQQHFGLFTLALHWHHVRMHLTTSSIGARMQPAFDIQHRCSRSSIGARCRHGILWCMGLLRCFSNLCDGPHTCDEPGGRREPSTTTMSPMRMMPPSLLERIKLRTNGSGSDPRTSLARLLPLVVVRTRTLNSADCSKSETQVTRARRKRRLRYDDRRCPHIGSPDRRS